MGAGPLRACASRPQIREAPTAATTEALGKAGPPRCAQWSPVGQNRRVWDEPPPRPPEAHAWSPLGLLQAKASAESPETHAPAPRLLCSLFVVPFVTALVHACLVNKARLFLTLDLDVPFFRGKGQKEQEKNEEAENQRRREEGVRG